MGNRVRAMLLAVTAGSLLVVTRRRRRAPGDVVKEKAEKVSRAARRAKKH
ncbi:MAG TPA: hypothetical protein VGL20_09725 [Candidatus Dormibacteraeota bacterium]|jgi:hypothetical protein